MSKYTVEPYHTLLDPMTGRQPTVLVTDPRGRHRAYRTSPVDSKYLEYVAVASRGDVPSFSAEHPLMGPVAVEAFRHPDIYAALQARSSGGDQGPAALAGTSVAFTIDGGTSQVSISLTGGTVNLEAIVTFVSGPTAPNESVAFWAQQSSGAGGPATQVATKNLNGSNVALILGFAPSGNPYFQSGTTYNMWAVYPGDAANAPSTSNQVSLKILAT
jgi:hypothetical protein